MSFVLSSAGLFYGLPAGELIVTPSPRKKEDMLLALIGIVSLLGLFAVAACFVAGEADKAAERRNSR